MDTLFQEENRIEYKLGSAHFKGQLVRFFARTCPNLFFTNYKSQTQKIVVFNGSFRALKTVLRPLMLTIPMRPFPTRTRRIRQLNAFPRFLVVSFMLAKFFITPTTRFLRSLIIGKAIDKVTQFYLYYFKLATYDFSGLR